MLCPEFWTLRGMTCGDVGSGGMKSLWKLTPSRLVVGSVGPFRAETPRLIAQVYRWTIQSTKRPAG
jgi:hypothetical protein